MKLWLKLFLATTTLLALAAGAALFTAWGVGGTPKEATQHNTGGLN